MLFGIYWLFFYNLIKNVYRTRKNSPEVTNYLNAGYQEAKRKISFTCEVEVWFDDKTKIVLK